MESNKTLTWVTNKGLRIEATCIYSATYMPAEDIDGGYGGTSQETYLEQKLISVKANGQYAGTAEIGTLGIALINGKVANHLILKNNGYDYALSLHGASRPNLLGITEEQRLNIHSTFAEMERGAPEDVCRLKAAEVAAKKAKELEKARKVIAAQDKAIKAFGHLPTASELATWQKQYNDIHNEGGEGYIPTYVTVEQVRDAYAVLAAQAE